MRILANSSWTTGRPVNVAYVPLWYSRRAVRKTVPALVELIGPCGPTFDESAADRTKERLNWPALQGGWLELLNRAWPALQPVFGASPYLAHLASRRPLSLRESLEADPDDRLAHLIKQVNSVGCESGRAGLQSDLRRLKMDAHLFLALIEVSRLWPVSQVMSALSEFADAALANAFAHACRLAAGVTTSDGCGSTRYISGIFVIALGKLGGGELNYSSDVDLAIFYDSDRIASQPRGSPDRFAASVTDIFRDLINSRTADGYVFRLDHRLRPDSSSTPLALPVRQAIAYYEARGQSWERGRLY